MLLQEADQKQLEHHMGGGKMRLCLLNSVLLRNLSIPTIYCWENFSREDNIFWTSTLMVGKLKQRDKTEGLYKRWYIIF